MLSLPEDAYLYDVGIQELVNGRLVRLDRELAKKGIDAVWWTQIASKSLRSNELDHHWRWQKIVGEKHHNAKWDCLAVLGPEEQVEGAIVFRIDALSQIEIGKGTVFVDRLAVAPRNRDWLVNPRKYARVGSVLLFAAVRQSYFLNLGGRVWVNCLPDKRSQAFYKDRGFEFLSEDEDGMIDYELPTREAQRWLIENGCLDG